MSTDQDSGRVAVITGASSGIGETTARALAGDGYRLALLARRTDRIEALASDLGDGAIAIEADVTDRDSLVAAAERVDSELGRRDERVAVGHVGLDRDRAVAEVGGEGLDPIRTAREQREAVSVVGERSRRRLADSRRGARDHRDAS